jgi:hypothetical protein
VWRDEYEQITLFIVGTSLAEQSANERQVDEYRNTRLGLRGLGDGESVNDRDLAIAYEELGIADLLAEDEPYV